MKSSTWLKQEIRALTINASNDGRAVSRRQKQYNTVRALY